MRIQRHSVERTCYQRLKVLLSFHTSKLDPEQDELLLVRVINNSHNGSSSWVTAKKKKKKEEETDSLATAERKQVVFLI